MIYLRNTVKRCQTSQIMNRSFRGQIGMHSLQSLNSWYPWYPSFSVRARNSGSICRTKSHNWTSFRLFEIQAEDNFENYLIFWKLNFTEGYHCIDRGNSFPVISKQLVLSISFFGLFTILYENFFIRTYLNVSLTAAIIYNINITIDEHKHSS